MGSNKRKDRFFFRTTKMSDEVYEHLERKSSQQQLADYIIELVQRDLNNEPIQLDFKGLTEKIESLQQEFQRIDKIHIKSDKSDIETLIMFDDMNEDGISSTMSDSDFDF